MNNSENSVLSHYLRKLNETPLLKRFEEVAIVEKIEIAQNAVIAECLKYEFFVLEFLSLLQSNPLDNSVVISLTRKLHLESEEADIKIIHKDLVSLIKLMEDKSNYTQLIAKAVDIKFTGTVVNQLITKINKKYDKIQECDDSLKNLLRYFECSSVEDLDAQIKNIKSDSTIMDYTVKKYYTTQSKLMSRIYDYEQYKLQFKALQNIGISLSDLSEIKAIYKSIVRFEFDMQHHKSTLVKHNLRLVVSRAKVHLNKGLEFEDLIQEGNLGLMKAINKYDRSRGTKISTYATWWIDQTIRRSISNKSRTVRIPTHIEFLQTTLLKVSRQLVKKLNREPTLKELAKAADVPEQKLLDLQQRAIFGINLQESIGEGVKLEDILSGDESLDPFNIIDKKVLRERVRSIIGSLSPRSEKIIRLRFGIGEPQEEHTLSQIASEIGLTKMGVKQAQTRALKELKKKGDFDYE